MTSLDLDLYRQILNGVIEELDRHVSQLAAGSPSSWDDYRYRVGYIKGLRDALAIAERAQEEVLGLNKNREKT